MIKENQKTLNILLLWADSCCIIGSLFAAYGLRFIFFSAHPAHLRFSSYLLLLPGVLLLHLFLGGLMGLYRSKRSNRLLHELRILFQIDTVTAALVLIALYLFHQSHYSRLCLFLWFLLTFTSVSVERVTLRLVLRAVRKRGYNLKYILLIGNGVLAATFVEKVEHNPNFGFRIFGCLCDKNEQTRFQGIPVLGGLDALEGVLAHGGIDEVVVALELEEYPKLEQIIALCEKNGIKLNVIPAYYQYVPARPCWDEFDGLPVMILRKIPLTNPWNAAIKRVFDVVFSLFALMITAPLMALVAIVIRLSSGESPIYRQERIGLNGRPFIMYKFRSMRTSDETEPTWTRKRDPRCTAFGRWIRRLSIDELPQFYNVLKGDMSVVGPRPEMQFYVEQFRESIPRYMVKHQVKPGITGLAQIQGLRGDTSIEQRVRQDLRYLESWSLGLDLYIILRTVTKAFYNHNE